MRALEVAAPWGLDQLKMVERAAPTPGPGQVLVRVTAISLNYRDLMMVNGSYGRGPSAATAPITPFSDGCGIVEAVGEGVSRVRVGDRVASMFFQGWIEGPPNAAKAVTALGFPIPGVGAELALLSEQGVSKVPDHLTDEGVATLPCAGLTAWRAMFEDARLLAGQSVVLQGTGGVSIFGLQFAKAAGLRAIITSSSDEKLERAKALGADVLINYRHEPEWSKPVKAATGGAGADFIMEVGGGGTIQQSMRAVRIGGHVALIGVLAGAGEGFNPAMLISNSATLQGVFVGSRTMFEDMCKAIAAHGIRPVVDKVFPWEETRAALEAMRDGAHFGKIVLKVG